MSKSQVKMSSKIEKSATECSNVQKALAEGQRLNLSRCQQDTPRVDCAAIRKKEKKCREREARVWKVCYDEEDDEACECRHGCDFILDRSLMTRSEHVRFLARPKVTWTTFLRVLGCSKINFQIHRCRSRGFWKSKKITPASLHVKELSNPKRLHLQQTFKEHLDHLSMIQAQNFLDRIHKKDYQTPREAVAMMKSKVKQSKQQKSCRIQQPENFCCIENFSQITLDKFREFLTDFQQHPLSEDPAKYSDVILRQLCDLMRQHVPEKDSCCLIDRILCKIADKFAKMFATFIEKSSFRDIEPSNCEGATRKCFSIEDFVPLVPEESSSSVKSEIEEQDEVQTAIQSEAQISLEEPETEKKLSFLRKSQIHLNPGDCNEISTKLAIYQKQKEERDNRKAKRAALKRELARKARQDKKKKNRKGNDGVFDCYGNINKKPQWVVEWVDKNSP